MGRIGQRSRGALSLAVTRASEVGGSKMVSAWWVIAAFWAGGCAGVLVMALMHMSGGLPEQSAHAPDLNGLPW